MLSDKKKECNISICSNIGGLRGYYAKCNKSDKKSQMLYDITYIQNQRNSEQKKKADSKIQRTNQGLQGQGEIQRQGSECYKLLGLDQTQGCSAQNRGHRQYFVMTVNGK